MKNLNQKAFAPVEILVVVLVMIVIAFIGYSAWQRSTSKTSEGGDASVADAAFYTTARPEWQYRMKVQLCRFGYSARSGISIKVRSRNGLDRRASAYVQYGNANTSFSNSEVRNGSDRPLTGYTGSKGNPKVNVYRSPYEGYAHRFSIYYRNIERC